jgi:hypothetical protein
MKRALNHMGAESFSFRNDNKLKIFLPNWFKFKPKDHIIIDEFNLHLIFIFSLVFTDLLVEIFKFKYFSFSMITWL